MTRQMRDLILGAGRLGSRRTRRGGRGRNRRGFLPALGIVDQFVYHVHEEGAILNFLLIDAAAIEIDTLWNQIQLGSQTIQLPT